MSDSNVTDTLETTEKGRLADAIIRNCYGSIDGVLTLGGFPVTDLVQRYGTPLYVYCADVVKSRLAALQEALPEPFEIHYSMKANPARRLLEFLVGEGCGLEVASGGELMRALAAGCDPGRILFAGPGKTDDELSAAIEAGVGELHLESASEVGRAADCARRIQRVVNVALRVNPLPAVAGGAMRMGGKAAPFGIDEERLPEVVDLVERTPDLDLAGIHLFAGTQILSHETLLAQYQHAITIAQRVCGQIGRPLRTIDFGGGFGVPYFPHEQRLDLNALAQGIANLIEHVRRDPFLRETRLIVEPGRFLVAESGVYLARVLDVKTSRGTTFLIVDGGMHHHLAASGNLGQTLRRNFPLALANKLNGQPEAAVDIAGVLCTPLDTLARKVSLPLAQPGDVVAILNSGAYGRSASPLHFLSHEPPREVWIQDSQHIAVDPVGMSHG